MLGPSTKFENDKYIIISKSIKVFHFSSLKIEKFQTFQTFSLKWPYIHNSIQTSILKWNTLYSHFTEIHAGSGFLIFTKIIHIIQLHITKQVYTMINTHYQLGTHYPPHFAPVLGHLVRSIFMFNLICHFKNTFLFTFINVCWCL